MRRKKDYLVTAGVVVLFGTIIGVAAALLPDLFDMYGRNAKILENTILGVGLITVLFLVDSIRKGS